MVMTWDEHYQLWRQACEKRGPSAHLQMQEARKRVALNSPEDWRWLEEALADRRKSWFVVDLFKFQQVPKRLAAAMLRAAVLIQDPSMNRYYLKPLVRSFGIQRVRKEILRYFEEGTDVEKAGAADALYWIGYEPQSECDMLREFVVNTDLQVRRHLISLLSLKPESYPEAFRSLVPVVIQIARSHPDEYIRHRVEIQLGAAGPFMPIPSRAAAQPPVQRSPDPKQGDR